MAASSSDSYVQPNLIPILDMVFQLITFFILVMNYKEAALDQTLHLPVLGSARPLDTKGQDDVLVLNIDSSGQLKVYGKPVDNMKGYIAAEARQEETRVAKKNPAFKRGDELPTMVVIRADKSTPFKLINDILKVCQSHNYRSFALKAMSRQGS